jgi:hypothetical protein
MAGFNVRNGHVFQSQVEPVIVHDDRRLASTAIETGYHLTDRHFIGLVSIL